MAIKKSELYSSLWKSCDALRGGMDASQYKDYVLVILFVKYVSDRARAGQTLLDVPAGGSFQDLLALKNDPEIGDKTNKVIAKLAAANDLQGVIDLADFNDPDKLGRGKEMVDKLTDLFGIFDRPELDFGTNAAEGDDLLGDAYEYLMRHFATESGKSKGQFYTPAEVSRILAKVVGLDGATNSDQTIYDPTCGSGSLLLKAHAEALASTGLDLAVYGQEMDNATAALSKMNMILHGVEGAEIWQANTLSSPHFKDERGRLQAFDFVVANPPFSSKSWTTGVDVANDPFGRFQYGTPPPKNGDYAFLLHMLSSLKADGKAAVILPHGVLFRGNAEYGIRKELVRRGFIKAVIGLPGNLFYGTGIPAVIIVLDKEGAGSRDSIFMINASTGFMKDGAKNRLRERDIHKIVDTCRTSVEIEGFSRAVPLSEISNKENDYNLNIPRYIEGAALSPRQDLSAHLYGGVPERDLDHFANAWKIMPSLRGELFAEARPGYAEPRLAPAEVASCVASSAEFRAWWDSVDAALSEWAERAATLLTSLSPGDKPKLVVQTLAEDLLATYRPLPLVDEYAAYQALLSYWATVMHDDVFAVVSSNWMEAMKPIRVTDSKDVADYTVGKTRFRSQLLPAEFLVAAKFANLANDLNDAESAERAASAIIDELLEEQNVEEAPLYDLVSDGTKVTKRTVQERLKAVGTSQGTTDESAALTTLIAQFDALDKAKSKVKGAREKLNAALGTAYASLTLPEVIELSVRGKWLAQIERDVRREMDHVAVGLTDDVAQLVARYRKTLADVTQEARELAAEVDEYLKRMAKP